MEHNIDELLGRISKSTGIRGELKKDIETIGEQIKNISDVLKIVSQKQGKINGVNISVSVYKNGMVSAKFENTNDIELFLKQIC